MKRLLSSVAAVSACAILAQLAFVPGPAAASSDVVISQSYKTGGDAGATYKHDYVELFNRSGAPVDVTGWSIQYRFNPLLEWYKIADLSGPIAPGGYYLVQLPGEAAGNGADLPPPDALGSSGLAVNRGGSLVLITLSPNQFFCGQVALSADRVDHKHAFCPEGTEMPDFTTDVAALRDGAGCTDTDNNLADFSTGAPVPRNSSSPPYVCGVVGISPTATPASALLGQAKPNPSAAGTEFAFRVAQGGPVRLGVFDLRGRRLRMLLDGWRPAGDHRVSWDGTREDGTVAAAGVYFVRFEAPGERVRDTLRFLRVR